MTWCRPAVVLALFSLGVAHAQQSYTLGYMGAYGRSTYSTTMPVLGPAAVPGDTTRWPSYADATGSVTMPVSVAARLRFGDPADVRWLMSAAVGMQVSSVHMTATGFPLPYIDSTGNIGRADVQHQLTVDRRSAFLMVGVGGELAGVGVQVLGRTSYVYDAQSVNIMTATSPWMQGDFFPDSPPPGARDDGRTLIMERIPTSGNHQVLFEIGATLMYSLSVDVLSLPMVFSLQPYVFLPLTSVHVNYSTTEHISYGGMVFVGVTL